MTFYRRIDWTLFIRQKRVFATLELLLLAKQTKHQNWQHSNDSEHKFSQTIPCGKPKWKKHRWIFSHYESNDNPMW